MNKKDVWWDLWTENEKIEALTEFIKERKRITSRDVVKRFGVSMVTARFYLRIGKAKGLIKSFLAGRKYLYEVV